MNSSDESALKFPCKFPIKAMGHADSDIEQLVTEIIRKHVPDVGANAFNNRPSREGKYISVTATITATSREQLDNIYRELTACEHIIMAL